VHDALVDGRQFRVLAVVDQWSRLSPILDVAPSMSDRGTEFTSSAMDEWAYRRGLTLDFIHPGKPVENGFVESFNRHLRDECLNANQFLSIDDARCKIEAWWVDYNHHRPPQLTGSTDLSTGVQL
jgi:putative transposase